MTVTHDSGPNSCPSLDPSKRHNLLVPSGTDKTIVLSLKKLKVRKKPPVGWPGQLSLIFGREYCWRAVSSKHLYTIKYYYRPCNQCPVKALLLDLRGIKSIGVFWWFCLYILNKLWQLLNTWPILLFVQKQFRYKSIITKLPKKKQVSSDMYLLVPSLCLLRKLL